MKGDGNQYDYGFRIYDPRLVRFLSVDPLFQSYPWYTPYQFAGNMPIWAIDLDGLEEKKVTSYNRIYDMNGNLITTPTVVKLDRSDVESALGRFPGFKPLGNGTFLVTPGDYEMDGDHVLPNTTNAFRQNSNGEFVWFRETTPQPVPNNNLVQTPDDDGVRKDPPGQQEKAQIKKPVPTPATPPQKQPKPKESVPKPVKPPATVQQQPSPKPLPPAPDPARFCLTCFNGDPLHWSQGINDLANWLTNNPDYNLYIKPDGGSSLLRREWDQPTSLWGGDRTYRQRAFDQFRKVQGELQKRGINPGRVGLKLGDSKGEKLNYQVLPRR